MLKEENFWQSVVDPNGLLRFSIRGKTPINPPPPSKAANEKNLAAPTQKPDIPDINGYITPEGLMLFDTYLNAKKRFLEFQNFMYNFYLNQGNREEAEFRLELMIKLAYLPGEYAIYWVKKGSLMEGDRNYSAAAEAYREGLEYYQSDPTLNYFLRNNLGYSLNQLGQFSEGESWCRQAIEFDWNRPNAHKNLGLALKGQGQYLETAQSFINGTKAWPGDSRSFGELRQLMEAQPDIEMTHLDIAEFITAASNVIENVHLIGQAVHRDNGNTTVLPIPLRILIAASQVAGETGRKVFTPEELRQRTGVDQQTWELSYKPVLQGMRNGRDHGEEDELKGYRGVFHMEGLTEMRFTERGEMMAELVGKIVI